MLDTLKGFHIEPTNICTLKCPRCARTKFIEKFPQKWKNSNLDLQDLQDLQKSHEHIRKQLPIKKNNNVDIYFVRHAESCSNISTSVEGKITHPPLSYKGMQQAINLGINNKIIDMDFDKYYCSPSLRTIMTACLALRNKSIITPITLKLNSNLIEKRIPFIGNYDKQNSVVPKQNLKNMINYIKLWFKQYYFNNYIDYEFVHIIYDLVLLLNYNNKLDKYKIKIIKLLEIAKICRKKLLKKLIYLLILEQNIENANKIGIINKANNNDINNIYNNILQFLETPEKFIIYYVFFIKHKKVFLILYIKNTIVSLPFFNY
jgi:hypothetical protein